MKDTKEIVNDLYHIVMTLNDPEFGLDWMRLKPELRKYVKKLLKNIS